MAQVNWLYLFAVISAAAAAAVVVAAAAAVAATAAITAACPAIVAFVLPVADLPSAVWPPYITWYCC